MLGIAFSTCTVFIVYIFFNTFLEQKERWKPVYITLLLVVLGISTNTLTLLFERAFPQFGVVRLILSAIKMYAMFLAAAYPLQGAWKKKAKLALLLFVVTQISYSMASVVNSANFRTAMGTDGVVLPISYLLLFSLIHFLLVSVIRIHKKRISQRGNEKQRSPDSIERVYILELVVPSMSLAVIYYLFITKPPLVGYYGLFLLVINVACFLIYGQMEQYYRWNNIYALREQEQQLKQEHYNELEAQQEGIRSIKHDIANQLIAMGAFVKSGEIERADEQLGQLIRQLEENNKLIFTDNAGSNGLLARKYKEAEENGIQCDFQISLPATTGFADTDLTVLLGNILDNALEACMHCNGQRSIQLEILSEDDVLIIRSKNSTDGKAQSIKTRKKDTLRHGIGMESIKQVVEKYNGDIKYRFGQDRFDIELSMFC